MTSESFPTRRTFGCEFNNLKRKKEGRKSAAAEKKKKTTAREAVHPLERTQKKN